MHTEPELHASIHGVHDYLDAVGRLQRHEARPLSLRLYFPSFEGEASVEDARLAYLGYLKRELAMHAALFSGKSRVRQLCFDGTAPAGLADAEVDRLLGHLREHFCFMAGDAGDYEVCVDVASGASSDVGHGDAGTPAGRIGRLRRQGFNRIRFDYRGAGNDPYRLRRLVDAARDAGFRSVCVALAYGRPEQGFALVRRMLEATVDAAPDRVLLCHRPGTDTDENDIPAGSVAQRMQQLCIDRLDMASYTRTGSSGFARLPASTGSRSAPGGVPDDGPGPACFPGTYLVGCGVRAVGAIGQVVRQNATSLREYYALLDRNALPVARVLHNPEPCVMRSRLD